MQFKVYVLVRLNVLLYDLVYCKTHMVLQGGLEIMYISQVTAETS